MIVLSVLLQGCAALEAIDWLTPASKGIEVETELTVGDKEETIETHVGADNTSQQAEVINNVQDIPFSYILLFMLMAGWAIPSPSEMWRGLMNFFRMMLPWTR